MLLTTRKQLCFLEGNGWGNYFVKHSSARNIFDAKSIFSSERVELQQTLFIIS